ncbi:hypothetical protein F53441_57 [Fusarium austroafricanum]|uniref:Uncharacterized protein n=1 Tax=Fusarium austroafricanum TaxID=2364996 RepID=A0A8H4KVN9_9HYPO|nr:hypothetical protein F53441_57 [Fusarium austroafricanum]
MEDFGAFTGAATLVTLVRPTAKFVESLSSIASDNGVVAEEIRRMSSHIQMSAAIIDTSLEALKGHFKALKRTKHTPSPVLHKQMNDIVRDLKDMKERPKIIKKLKWILRNKMEVESLFPEMQLVASSLSLICPIIRLEIDEYLLKEANGDEIFTQPNGAVREATSAYYQRPDLKPPLPIEERATNWNCTSVD